MDVGKMLYSPDNHIHLVVKRPTKSQKDDMTLDEFLGLVYNAVA